MQNKSTSLQKEALNLLVKFDLDQITIVGQKRGTCEFTTYGSSINNFATALETLRFILNEEKEFISDFKENSFLGMLLVNKLFEVDYLFSRYIGSKKEISYN